MTTLPTAGVARDTAADDARAAALPAIGWALAGIVILFFIVTMVRIGAHVTTVTHP